LLTYLLLALDFWSAPAAQQSLGLLLLFSAGSFIYVATVHVLPEIKSSSAGDDPHGHGGGSGGLDWPSTLLLVAGILLPLLFTVGHDHAHGHGAPASGMTSPHEHGHAH